MRSGRRATILFGVVLLAAGFAAGYEKYEATSDETYPLQAGGEVSLENINGDVVIEVWDRAEVRVEATKTASSPDLLDALKIEVDASSRAVRIDTRYPSNRRSDDEWHDHDRPKERRHMKVEYTLTVPRSAVVNEVELVNGDLLVVGVEGGVEAETVNGNMVVRQSAGDFSLSTVNGGIELYADHLASSDAVEMETVNGSLDLYLGGSAGADIRAESLNGRISNDFGIEVHKGKYVGSDLNGVVRGGGSRVDLETVNGSISVHSR